MPLAVVSVAMAMALLILAASSGPVRVWITPSETRSPSGERSGPATIGPQIPVSSDRIALPSWIATLQPFIGVLLIVLVVIAMVSVRIARPLSSFRWRRSRWWRSWQVAPLPEVTERELTVDVAAALAALAAGSPRNAIVACWMQLESDAAKVGLPRMVAETPAEYVERVVVSSSVDPAPIKELAELYREARFSHHKLDDTDRARALDTLHRVEATLRHKRRVPA